MARLIDIEKRMEEWRQLLSARYPNLPCQMLHSFLLNAPTVDAVPVVKCKDCKYYVPHRDYTWSANTMRCNHPELTFDIECYDHWLEVGPEDFCSRGERRDGGAVDGI